MRSKSSPTKLRYVHRHGHRVVLMAFTLDYSPFVSLLAHRSNLFPFGRLIFSSVVLVQAAEGRQEELTQRGAKEKRELEMRIEEMEEKEQVLQARIEALQADNDFTNERLAALQGTEHTHIRRAPPPCLTEVSQSCVRTHLCTHSALVNTCLLLLFVIAVYSAVRTATGKKH